MPVSQSDDVKAQIVEGIIRDMTDSKEVGRAVVLVFASPDVYAAMGPDRTLYVRGALTVVLESDGLKPNTASIDIRYAV